MTDREKLGLLIRESLCFGYDDITDTEYVKCEETAKKMIANGVTVQEWISVKDRLPKEFVSVLVYMPSEAPFPTVHEGYYVEKDECFMVHICGSVYTSVTHWMPLPQPPKGE